MKKQLLFIMLICVGFVGYGQTYTQAGSVTALGIINDIYVTKVPNSLDSIYLSVQGKGVYTTQTVLSSTPTLTSKFANTNSNIKISIEDFFNRGKPDLMVSHYKAGGGSDSDSTYFNIFKDLSTLMVHKRLQVKEAGTIKWRKVFNDITMYLLFATQSNSNEYMGLYTFGASELSEKVKMGNYKYGNVMGEFVNVKNNGTIDVIATGALSDNNAVADRYPNSILKSSTGNIYSNGISNTLISGNDVYGYLPGKIVTGDIDNDGWEDIVIMGEEKSSTATTTRTMSFSSATTIKKIIWFRNNTIDGTFIKQGSGIVDVSDISKADFVLGDFNYDGKVDICVADNGNLKLYINDGSGNFTENTISSSLTAGQHRIGLYVNTLANGKKRLDIFVSSDKTLYRFYQSADSISDFTLVKPSNLTIDNITNKINQDDGTIIGKDITAAWSKVGTAVSYDGFMMLTCSDGLRDTILHKSIPLAIHGNLGNGNIEGTPTNTKKAKFFIPQNLYTRYVGGTATIRIWSVDGAYRRSTDSATISIVIPPVTPDPNPLPPTDSICPSCPTDPNDPNNVYRRPRVRMVSATSFLNTTADTDNYNTITTTFKSQLAVTGWTRPLTNAGFYFSTDSMTLVNLTFLGNPAQQRLPATIIPDPITSGLILDSVNVATNYRDSLNLQQIIVGRRSLLSGTTYFVRAFAVNTAGPVFSNKGNLTKFTTARQQGTINPPTEPPTDGLPPTENEDDNGNLDSIPLTGIGVRDVPIFYKRFPQGYPYQTMRDSISITVESTSTKHPVRLDFKKKDPLSTPNTYGDYILNNRTDTAYNDDRVVLTTKKILHTGHAGLNVPVTPRGYALDGDTLTRHLKILPKYRLQQHFLSSSDPINGCTVIIRRGVTHNASTNTESSSRTDTLNIIVNNGPSSNLIPNQQKSIPLSSFVVSSSYAKIRRTFPTVDTSYLDTVAPNRTRYSFDNITGGGTTGRFDVNAGNFRFLPKDTTFKIKANNEGNDFFKSLNDSLYVRIRLSQNIIEFPDPPGGDINVDTVTIVVPDRNGRDSIVRVTGFPTDGIRVFYQNGPYGLPAESVAVITTTIRNSDSTIQTTTIRRPIEFKTQQPIAAGAKFRMNGRALITDSINTGFCHSDPQRIVYKHRDSIWIETTGRTPIQSRVPLYIIPKRIYDYKVIQNGNPTFTPAVGDSYSIVNDTINILKRSNATTGSSTMNIRLQYNKNVFSAEQLKYLYPPNNIHQGKTPKFTNDVTGNRITSISIPLSELDKLAITYPNTLATGIPTDGKVKLTGDSITFFKSTARSIHLRVRRYDSIPNNILSSIGVLGDSILSWCSVTDSVHPRALVGTTSPGNRPVRFEVVSTYLQKAQLTSDNKIKMLDTGRIVIRAYVDDNGDLPSLERSLHIRIVACTEAINNSNIDWLKPTKDTLFSTLFRDEFELKAIVRQLPRGAVRYEITEGFEHGSILSGNRFKLQGTMDTLTIRASYAGSVFYRPSEKFIRITIKFIKNRQVVVEQLTRPAAFISHSTIRAYSLDDSNLGQYQNFVLKDLIGVRDSVKNIDLTQNAKLRVTIEPIPINGRVIQNFPRQGDPVINNDTTLFEYNKPVGVPVRLTIVAKEDSFYYESRPYQRNILIIGDTQNPSLILPEYPGKDCFDIKAELAKHHVTDFTYVDALIYNRYGSNVMNLTAKAAEENCLYDVQKLKDGVYLCVLYVNGDTSQPYCSYITIVRSK